MFSFSSALPRRQNAAGSVLDVFTMYEPLFERYTVNKFICCMYVSLRLFLLSCLWWQLSSTMTEVVLTPRTGCCSYDDLDDGSDYGWVGADAPNTFGRFTQAVLLNSCHTFCYVAFADQYFIRVYRPCSCLSWKGGGFGTGRVWIPVPFSSLSAFW